MGHVLGCALELRGMEHVVPARHESAWVVLCLGWAKTSMLRPA
jgi:hypothetical protein